MTQGASNAPASNPQNLNTMKKVDLLQAAGDLGIDADASDTKAQIINKIEAEEA